jgi:hypothetical protein
MMDDVIFEPNKTNEVSTPFGKATASKRFETYRAFTAEALEDPVPIYAVSLSGAEAALLVRNPYTVSVAGSDIPHLIYTEVDEKGIPLRKSGIITPWNIQCIALTDLAGVRVIQNDSVVNPAVGAYIAVDNPDSADIIQGTVRSIDANTIRIGMPDGPTVSLERIHRLCFYYVPGEV